MKLAYLALPLAAATVAVVGCGGSPASLTGHHTQPPAPVVTTTAPTAAAPAIPASSPPPNLLTCTTVVTSGSGGSLTTNQVIYALFSLAVLLAAPDTPVDNGVNTVSGFAGDAALMFGNGTNVMGPGYSGNQLSTDATQFATDAGMCAGVSMASGGEVNVAYAPQVRTDIEHLVADCPDALSAGNSPTS